MKRLHILSIILCILCFGCVEPVVNESLIRVEGLLGFSIAKPEAENVEYTISNLPIEDGKTLIIKIESDENEPVDLTRLIPKANLGINASMTPTLTGLTDFTNPLDIYVTDRNKITHHYKIQVELIPPKLSFEKLWTKSMSELEISDPNDWGGIAVTDNRLVINRYNKLKIFNKTTGEFISEIKNALDWSRQINADEAGHLVVSNYCVYGGYFENKLIDIDDIQANGKPKEKQLGYYTNAEVEGKLMQKVTITGDVTKGTAYIYGTAGNDNGYYILELKDGAKVSGAAVKQSTPFGNKIFKRATIKRKTIAPDSEIIMTGLFGPDNNPGDQNTDYESRWIITKNLLQYKEIDNTCFPKSILDYDYFTIGGEEFVAMAVQSGLTTPIEMRLYNISKDVYIECKPEDESGIFREFLCFQSESLNNVGYYYDRIADVAVQVIGDEAYLFLYSGCAPDQLTKQGGGVIAYYMKYTKE